MKHELRDLFHLLLGICDERFTLEARITNMWDNKHRTEENDEMRAIHARLTYLYDSEKQAWAALRTMIYTRAGAPE